MFGVLVLGWGYKGCGCVLESIVGESVVNFEYIDIIISVIGGKGVG